MKHEDLLTALGLLDERFITEAEQLAKPLHQDEKQENGWIEIPLERVSRMEVKANRRRRITAWIAVAAVYIGCTRNMHCRMQIVKQVRRTNLLKPAM